MRQAAGAAFAVRAARSGGAAATAAPVRRAPAKGFARCGWRRWRGGGAGGGQAVAPQGVGGGVASSQPRMGWEKRAREAGLKPGWAQRCAAAAACMQRHKGN